jgi:hypothetical protein
VNTAAPAERPRPGWLAVTGRRDAAIAVALTAAALLPVLVVVLTRWGRHYVPVGDIALIDLRVRDVWSRAIPLVGPYSRLGWNHPGPAMFWLIAPLSGLTGRPAWATLVGGALVQGIAVVAVGRLAWRKGGLVLVAAALALNGLAYGARGPSVLLEAWNPNVTYPFLLVLVLESWCIADGDLALLPATALVATFLVQTHIGYLPLVAVSVGFGLVAAGLRTRRGVLAGAQLRRPVWWSVAILAVGWAPPALQEIVHHDNVAPLFRSLLGNGARLGPRVAAGIFGAEFRPPPPWLGGRTHLDPFNDSVVPVSAAYLLVPVVILLVGAVAARRDPPRRRAVALTALLACVGVWSISRVVGGAERYAFYWRVPLALLVVFVGAAAVWYRLGLDRRAGAVRATAALLAIVVLASSITFAVDAARWGDVSPAEPLARVMLTRLRAEHLFGSRNEPSGRVLVRAPDSPLIGLERTLVNELARSGAQVRVDTDLGFQFGYSRVATPNQVDEVWYVVEGGQYLSIVTGHPGARVLWETAALPPAQERTMRVLQRRLWDQMQRAGHAGQFGALNSPLLGFTLSGVPGIDAALVDRVARLNAEAQRHAQCRCAVIAFRAADAPTLTLPP